MAKNKKSVKRLGGPFLAAAFFCETTMEDKQDGAISAIRMVDQLTLNLAPSTPPEVPSKKTKLPVYIAGLLSFKTGDAPGDHVLSVVVHSPSGKSQEFLKQTLPFSKPPHGGANLRLNNVIHVYKGGLFWFDIFLDGKRMTRMPLQITIQRAEVESKPASK